eukprot:jgi/Picre1/33592/NNA_001072.t1
MSTPDVSAYETGRMVKLYLRMEIANPQQFWNFDHDANAYVELQMDLFSDKCTDPLTEHLPEGSIFIHDRETLWLYSTHMIGSRKANYRAILQCCHYFLSLLSFISLGVSMWVVWTGCLAWKGGKDVQVFYAVTAGKTLEIPVDLPRKPNLQG